MWGGCTTKGQNEYSKIVLVLCPSNDTRDVTTSGPGLPTSFNLLAAVEALKEGAGKESENSDKKGAWSAWGKSCCCCCSGGNNMDLACVQQGLSHTLARPHTHLYCRTVVTMSDGCWLLNACKESSSTVDLGHGMLLGASD